MIEVSVDTIAIAENAAVSPIVGKSTERRPVLVVRDGEEVRKAFELSFEGGRVRYSPDAPNADEARVWLELNGEVWLDEEVSQ